MIECYNIPFVEIIGLVLTLIYMYLEIKQDWKMWIVGILSSMIYIYVFFVAKLYAEVGINVYYMLMGFYGIFLWLVKKNKTSSIKKNNRSIDKKMTLMLSIFTTAMTGLIYYILKNYTDSPLPFWDAMIAALSITATWMLANKIIEHWFLWIAVNFGMVAITIATEIYITSALYLIYGFVSIYGYYEWLKLVKQEK
ncbi:nicotinamide riboside transporter [Bacteroidales bacterium]|nr:nicotinamide riboside transporter [Bacteroidales bacterium]